jgi:exosortase A-associated hydrolase 2
VPEHARLSPFFLDSGATKLFALLTAPRSEAAPKAAVLFCPPFGEEIAKSRVTCAMQARALAAAGHGALSVDLSCTADSEGEFAAASWEQWLSDVETAARWLTSLGKAERIAVLGLRLGALLAIDWLRRTEIPVSAAVLWQPVVSGRQFLKQFLRVRTVADTVAGETKTTVEGLLGELRMGRTLEVGGYAVSPALAAQLQSVELDRLWSAALPPVAWFEIVASEGDELAPASAKTVALARGLGAAVTTHVVVDQQFWRSTEIMAAPRLVAATSEHLAATWAR